MEDRAIEAERSVGAGQGNGESVSGFIDAAPLSVAIVVYVAAFVLPAALSTEVAS